MRSRVQIFTYSKNKKKKQFFHHKLIILYNVYFNKKKGPQIQGLMRNGWPMAASYIIMNYLSMTTPDLQHTAFQTPCTQLMF